MRQASKCLLIVGIVMIVALGLSLFLKFLGIKDVYAFTCDVPTGMYPTIQSAVVDDNCDLINLTAPTYMENVTITRSVTIQGQGNMTTTVDGGSNGRVFTIQPGSAVTLTNMMITNGLTPFGEGGGGVQNSGSHLTIQDSIVSNNSAFEGAGIYNDGNLVVLSTTVDHNEATFGLGGGILNVGGEATILNSQIANNSADDSGGSGISNSGRMTILGSTITDNQTMSGEGGGIVNTNVGVLTITNSVVDNNINLFGHYGGGIKNSGMLRLTDSHINNNNSGAGGGIFNSGNLIVEDSIFLENYGSAIANFGIFTVSNSLFSDNSGDSRSIENASSQLSTVTATTFSNNTGGGIRNQGNLVISNGIFENNSDGAINNSGLLTLTMSLLTGNSNSFGGAIYNGGSLLISDSYFDQNTANAEGGAIHNSHGTVTLIDSTLSNNSANYGGGISNGEALLHIAGSTFYQNSASVKGGGIYGTRAFWPGVIVVTNTTFYSNAAPLGGGVSNEGGHFYSINNTVFSNVANSGGGIQNTDGGLVQLTNTIIANTSNSENCGGNAAITSGGHNIASDNTCNLTGPGDMPDTDPLLGPLQDNGGDTWTHALLPGSPAIDAGNDLTCPVTDQRGVSRPIGDHCDIGAFEYNPVLTAFDDEAVAQLNTPLLIDVLANDVPGPNGTLMLDSVGVPMSGTAVITNSLVLYTPNLDFIGTDTFIYTITDGVVTDTAVVTVNVQPLIAPTAVDDLVETPEDEAVLIDVLANDLPGSSGSPMLASVGVPMSGTAVITDTFILYTPALDFLGTDTFTYTITDGVLTDTAVVTVTVLPVDDQTYIYLPVVLKP